MVSFFGYITNIIGRISGTRIHAKVEMELDLNDTNEYRELLTVLQERGKLKIEFKYDPSGKILLAQITTWTKT